MPSYSTFETEELVKKVQIGDQKAFLELSKRFDGMIHDISNVANVDSGEREDLYQEGLLGLYKASLAFDPQREAVFSTFAYLCIKHNIYSSLRVYFSKKNDPVRTGSPIDDAITVQCPDLCTEPEKLLIEKENIRILKESVDTSLSDYERRVLKLFLKGLSYEAIAELLSASPKSVDNAIQRIRGKLKRFIKCLHT